ncbi:MAG: hypothetical protein Q7R75_02470 [bacterium]|nr:hypothetical protein [bacterium]
MNFTPQQIKERYKTLPQDLKDVYFSEETAEKLTAIGKTNKLRTDQIGLLADETGLVMLGLIPTSEYITKLAEHMEIVPELAKKIAEEVNSQIFSQVREAMQKIHGIQGVQKEQKLSTPNTTPTAVSTQEKIVPKIARTTWQISALIHPQTSMPQPTPPIQKPEEKPTPPLQNQQNKIFEEKTKDESYRSSIETIEKMSLPAVPLNLPVTTTPPQENIKKESVKPLAPPKYPAGVDPYREPIN